MSPKLFKDLLWCIIFFFLPGISSLAARATSDGETIRQPRQDTDDDRHASGGCYCTVTAAAATTTTAERAGRYTEVTEENVRLRLKWTPNLYDFVKKNVVC